MEEWEKYEVNDYMCNHICWGGDHKCFQIEEENDLLGIDVKKIKSDYRTGTYDDKFKCEMCNYKNTSMKTVRSHFLNNHREDYSIKCWECGKEFKSISELRKHVGSYHFTSESE